MDLSPWDPLSTDELSAAILDILKAYQTQIPIDSMMCFSIGALAFDGLKQVAPEDFHFIPKNLIFNRGLTSIEKVSNRLFSFPVSSILYQLAHFFNLDSNPENELLQFLNRTQQDVPSLEKRKIVIIEAKHDQYFSGDAGFNPDFSKQIALKGFPTFEGTFFVLIFHPAAHHAIRLDLMINNHNSGTITEKFLPISTNESVASSIVNTLI